LPPRIFPNATTRAGRCRLADRRAGSTDDGYRNYLSLIEHGQAGGGWQIVPSPSPGLKVNGNTIIGAVLALSPDNIWAAGMFDGPGGHRTMVLHYTGPG
jgi:hypothetical protein